MKAFVVDRYGRKQSPRFGEMPNPELREDDVLVRVHAAGVNPLDSKIRDGEFKLILPYRLPLILGNDVSGVVVQVGSRERLLKQCDYDIVVNSVGKETLEKSLKVLKPGGKLISISGPPDPGFARDFGAGWIVRQVMRLLSYRIRRKAKRQYVNYSFLFMRANGEQLDKISSLIDAGTICPVVDPVFPLESTGEALAYVETG